MSFRKVFLDWPNYMDPDIIAEFAQRTGSTVKQRYFDSDTARDELLLKTEAKGYDQLRSTAEGVETPEQVARLAEEGCDQLQGYLLCRPLPAAEMTGFLKSRNIIDLPKTPSKVHWYSPLHLEQKTPDIFR